MRMFGRCRAKKHCPALAQATPLAPELGLFLDECFFEAYNDRWGSNRAATVRLSAFQEQMDAFKVGWDNCPYLIHSQVAPAAFQPQHAAARDPSGCSIHSMLYGLHVKRHSVTAPQAWTSAVECMRHCMCVCDGACSRHGTPI